MSTTSLSLIILLFIERQEMRSKNLVKDLVYIELVIDLNLIFNRTILTRTI